MTKVEKLDSHIDLLRKRLDLSERLRDAATVDPELFAVLLGESNDSQKPSSGNGTPRGKRGRPKASLATIGGSNVAQGYFDKIAAFLESKHNEPQGIPEMAAAIKLTKSNLIHVCYKTHAMLFESVSVEGHKTKKKWRLCAGWREILATAKNKK